MESKKVKLIKAESRMVVARVERMGKWKGAGKGIKVQSYTRCISSGDLMHSMVTEANKIVLEIFLRKLILSALTTHTQGNMR